MMSFILFVLSTIGLTNIIVHGKIFDVIGLRPFLKKNLSEEIFALFECYECTGFWAGMFCGAFLTWPHWWLILLYGFAGSVVSQLYTDLVYLLRSKIEFEVSDAE